MKPKLLASKFLDWYFSDRDDILTLGKTAVGNLKATGSYSINVKELFDGCGYIPGELCNKDYKKEYDPEEVELIIDIHE